MSGFLQDLRVAARTLRRNPGFATAAILCLGLGIGVNATIWSVVDSMLFRPLPYGAPDRLVSLDETLPRQGVVRQSLSYAEFADWRAGSAHTIESAAAVDYHSVNLSTSEEPQHVTGAGVSADFFRTMGVRPALGRDFRADDDRPGAARVAVLGHRLWELRFGADPAVVGREVRLNGEPATVIGVMPAGFEYPEFVQLWMPLAVDPAAASRADRDLDAVARLRPGVAVLAAAAELNAVAARLEELHPETNTGVQALVLPLRDRLVPSAVRAALLLMLGAVAFVLLIACANVANLLLARGVDRSREVAVRRALGAGRARVVRQLLAESLLLALGGGAVGALAAVWGDGLVRAAVPLEIPTWIRFGVDGRALVYVAAVSAVTAFVFGLAPALEASRGGVAPSLKEGGRSTTEGRGRSRLRSGLVMAEVALSLVLLISAALLVRSALGLRAMDPGFETRDGLTLRVLLAGPAYDDPARRAAFLRDLIGRVETLPGVKGAGAVGYLPLLDSWTSSTFELEGAPVARGDEPNATYHAVTTGVLDALGIPLVAGRDFTEREAEDPVARVAVVNEALARRFWPGADPLGRRIRTDPQGPWLTVVGVARTLRRGLLIWDVSRPELEIYAPYAVTARRDMTVVVRTDHDPASLAPSVRSAVRSLDPDLAAFDVRTLAEHLDRVFWLPRFLGQMFAAFAGVALVLAAIGVYGVMAYAVNRRRHEIGVRLALGARSGDVRRLVVRQGMVLAAVGAAAGLAIALAVTRLLARLLYGVSATDPATFLLIPLALGAVALLASWLPARRAARVDPMVALRYE